MNNNDLFQASRRRFLAQLGGFNKLPGFIARLEKLKTDINNLNDAPIFLDIDDEVVSVKSLYGDYDTPQDFLEAFD